MYLHGAPRHLPSSGQAADETVQQSAAITGSGSTIAQPTSSAEYLVSEVKRHKAVAFVALAALAITFAATFAWYSRPTSRLPAITSVVVLPFANTNGDPEIEYLSDGISESLINSLSQLPELKVIASSSSFRYKGKDADPQEVAKALGVEWQISERMKLNFIANFFNVTNSRKVRLPDQFRESTLGQLNPDFLQPQFFHLPFNMRLGVNLVW